MESKDQCVLQKEVWSGRVTGSTVPFLVWSPASQYMSVFSLVQTPTLQFLDVSSQKQTAAILSSIHSRQEEKVTAVTKHGKARMCVFVLMCARVGHAHVFVLYCYGWLISAGRSEDHKHGATRNRSKVKPPLLHSSALILVGVCFWKQPCMWQGSSKSHILVYGASVCNKTLKVKLKNRRLSLLYAAEKTHTHHPMPGAIELRTKADGSHVYVKI